MDLNRRLPPIDASRFSMTPRAEIPRSTFVTTHSVKTTFNASYLVPILCEEVLPGDDHQGEVTIFARLANLIFPLMDTLELETFFFFVPSRLLWSNWKKMMGERTNPADSISYTTPQITSAAGGFPVGSIYDYFGLPTVGQVGAGNTVSVNAQPLRAYAFIWNEWFRDQNLQNQTAFYTGDTGGGEVVGSYTLLRRNKKPDYFTSALPWPLKGGVDVTMPLAGNAPVLGLALNNTSASTAGPQPVSKDYNGTAPAYTAYHATDANVYIATDAAGTGSKPRVYADLSTATGATINALRTAFQTQRLLERDARGGTRYTEMLQAHFGVHNPDGRVQRPEYIGGGRTTFQTSAIPQTSATGATGTSTALGSLSAQAVSNDRHSFSYRATEFGWIIGLVNVRSELTYQQGLHRKWTRLTRYDHYWPVFANLGEQAVRNDELYSDGSANDSATFAYQERWAEYRSRQSMLTGLFRSTSAGNIDEWHTALQFSSLPALNGTFIQDDTVTVLQRVLAAGAAANNAQILFDSVFRIKSTRPMPMFSIPGMIDHL